MSTFTDGAPPSVAPEPDHSRPGPDHREQDGHAEPNGHSGSSGHSAAPDEPTEGSAWLRDEMARRIAARDSASGGRHARRDNGLPVPITGRAPRHAVAPPDSARPPGSPALLGPASDPWVRPPRRPDTVRDVQRADPASAPGPDPWTGPRRAERGPDASPGDPESPPRPAPSGRTQPVPARPPQPGRPDRPSVPARLGIGLPSRPAPPIGAAAARLLSPPSAPPFPAAPGNPSPSTPAPAAAVPAVPAGRSAVDATTQGIPARPLYPGPPTGPLHIVEDPDDDPEEPLAGPSVDTDDSLAGPSTDTEEVEDQILWSASALPPERPADVPPQRTSEPPGEPAHDTEASAKRVRVVLAERKGVARPVRTVVDIQEGTAVGELLRTNLIGSQLGVALRFAAFAALTLGALPLLFALYPAIGEIEIPYLRLRLPWLLLGFLVYPFLLGLGWWHTRCAERVEQNFADHVQE